MSKPVWTATVTIDFPVEEADIMELYDDDTYIDFIYRATQRLKAGLDKLEKDGLITHSKVAELPHIIQGDKK